MGESGDHPRRRTSVALERRGAAGTAGPNYRLMLCGFALPQKGISIKARVTHIDIERHVDGQRRSKRHHGADRRFQRNKRAGIAVVLYPGDDPGAAAAVGVASLIKQSGYAIPLTLESANVEHNGGGKASY
ncbi:hypothetical protein EVAR_39778_1 [Eumeta japonica]|uniref:Uncharacterized protein n=1 Tax=Eumeta variegata TaxID=151549 RepID=A0A4C1X4Y4_EUMVA|nr:hypothetical protein EVAR_39778_1 [Eumeta japonica]